MPSGRRTGADAIGDVAEVAIFFPVPSFHGRKVINWENRIVEFSKPLLQACVGDVPADKICCQTDTDDRTTDTSSDGLSGPSVAVNADPERLAPGDCKKRSGKRNADRKHEQRTEKSGLANGVAPRREAPAAFPPPFRVVDSIGRAHPDYACGLCAYRSMGEDEGLFPGDQSIRLELGR